MSMDFSKPQDQDGSKDRWIDKIHDAVEEVETLRGEIQPELIGTAPYDPPRQVDYYNRLVQRFTRRVRPKKRGLGAHLVEEEGKDPESSLWTQQVATVQVPKSGQTVEVGHANIHGEVQIDDPFQLVDWESKPVRLSNLRDWAEKQITVTVEFQKTGGSVGKQHIRKSVYLPVFALDAAVDQLNQCLDDLGWLPDASEKEIESEVLR